MSTYNRLKAKMTCPRCNQSAEMEIEVFFGDTRNFDTYAVGDKYKWIPRKAIQNGGRPEGGNIDGEGYTECPLCRLDFFVRVLVREDVIMAVEPNLEKEPYISNSAKGPDETQPVAPPKPKLLRVGTKKVEPMKPGEITYNPNWKLDKKRKTALLRLAELGVNVYSSLGSDNFRLLVPFNLHPDAYVEVGYLMAQLGDEDFPEGFHHPIAFSVRSELFDGLLGKRSPVSESDSVVQGYRFTVTPKKELN